MLKTIIVDDEVNALEALEWKLNRYVEDLQIIKCNSPVEALTIIEREKPELVFLDIDMPEMDAFDFLDKYSEIKNIKQSGYKPIIIIVSNYLFNNRNLDKTNRFKSIGVIDHIKKPMDKQDVLSILKEHIE